ncbi:MAG: hypothetical protein J1F16_05695 [Muribaculaceae bacterium]|nr:hypothetical protein [Muribaculaceae bacterium]
MKKFYYLFLALPFALLMSCNDDKNFSPVDMTLTLSGVTMVDNTFYTVADDIVTVNNLSVKAVDGKNTALNNIVFLLGNVPLPPTPGSTIISGFSTEDFPAGVYSLGITGTLLQVDSPVKTFAVSYPLVIVESQDDLPDGAPELGTYSVTIRIDSK